MTNPNQAILSYENGYINISGELNFATVMDLWQKSLFFISKESELKFDFSKVTQANSAALALLLEWLKYAEQHRKSISFNQLPDQLRSIAKVSGIEHLCHSYRA